MGDTLLYGTITAQHSAHKAHDFSDSATVKIDDDPFIGLTVGPWSTGISVSPSGGRIANTRNWDSAEDTGELRVASGTHFATVETKATAFSPARYSAVGMVAPTTSSAWLANGTALAFIDESASPADAAQGTLVVWNIATNATKQVDTNVREKLDVDDAGKTLVYAVDDGKRSFTGNQKAYDTPAARGTTASAPPSAPPRWRTSRFSSSRYAAASVRRTVPR